MDEILEVSIDMKDYIVSSGAETLSMCMQCGLCANLCPWRLVPGEVSEIFNIRKMQRQCQLGLEASGGEEELFACCACGMCQDNCPREIKIIDNVRALRSTTVGAGFIPKSLRPVVNSIRDKGNPWLGEPEQRAAWQEGLNIPAFTEDTEYLLYTCCNTCYLPRALKIAKSVVKVLQKAGVSFGVLTSEEKCCGESIRKLGDEGLFQKLANSNISLFNGKGVKKIITLSPHCMDTFKKDYPELGGEYEVVHYAEVLGNLLKEGKLSFPGELAKKVIYHDPCTLGRHNKIYDAPREILQAVPGLELLEFEREKSRSLCCAGGGGRIWAEVPMAERFANQRLEDAEQKKAEVLVTACPYCISVFDDTVASLEMGDVLQVMELAELLSEVI
jgi:Fe-S oxidoreductase